MNQVNIKSLTTEMEMVQTAEIIRNSFVTIADELGLTLENAPTNPVFMSFDQVKKLMENGVKLFGLFAEGKQAGCVGLEQPSELFKF